MGLPFAQLADAERAREILRAKGHGRHCELRDWLMQ